MRPDAGAGIDVHLHGVFGGIVDDDEGFEVRLLGLVSPSGKLTSPGREVEQVWQPLVI